jgi:uncharacterized protein YmfQ (DUF2313 family)
MHWYNLTELLPPVFKHIKQMFSASDTENEELLRLNSTAMVIKDNFFIQTCDSETLRYWEGLLGIEPEPGETIEQRRQDVLYKINNSQPITEPYLKEILTETFGAENFVLTHDPTNNLIVNLSIYNHSLTDINRFLKWLYTVLPAHIEINPSQSDKVESALFLYCHAESDVSSTATLPLTPGTATVYYGETASTVETLEV